MSPDQSSALDKIKKLLRMKNGGSDAEIETAMRMARDLADRNNIDLASVDLTEDQILNRLTHKAIPVSARGTQDEDLAEVIIKKFFHVDGIWETYFDPRELQVARRLNIIGTAVDIEIAEYVFEFLSGHFKRCWRRRPKRLRNRAAFVQGIFYGLYTKLMEGHQAPVSSSAALAPSRKVYIEKHWPNTVIGKTKIIPTTEGAAGRAGFHVGRNTNIRQGIKATPQPTGPAALPYKPQLELL